MHIRLSAVELSVLDEDETHNDVYYELLLLDIALALKLGKFYALQVNVLAHHRHVVLGYVSGYGVGGEYKNIDSEPLLNHIGVLDNKVEGARSVDLLRRLQFKLWLWLCPEEQLKWMAAKKSERVALRAAKYKSPRRYAAACNKANQIMYDMGERKEARTKLAQWVELVEDHISRQKISPELALGFLMGWSRIRINKVFCEKVLEEVKGG